MSGDGYRPSHRKMRDDERAAGAADLSDDEPFKVDVQAQLRAMLGSDSEGDADTADAAGDFSETITTGGRTAADLRTLVGGLERNGSNRSFTPNQVREIERNNSLLMNRILSHSTRKNQFPVAAAERPIVSSHFVNRKKKQREIDHHNLVLLKRIQSIKPFGLSHRKK